MVKWEKSVIIGYHEYTKVRDEVFTIKIHNDKTVTLFYNNINLATFDSVKEAKDYVEGYIETIKYDN